MNPPNCLPNIARQRRNFLRRAARQSPTASVKENIPKVGLSGQQENYDLIEISKPTPPTVYWPLNRVCRSMRYFAAVLLLLSMCSGQSAPITFDGQIQPTRGTCDPTNSATLVLKDTDFLFAPASGTLLLPGKRDGDRLAATLTLVGADQKPVTLSFRALRSASKITGIYTTPRCRYSVALHATQD